MTLEFLTPLSYCFMVSIVSLWIKLHSTGDYYNDSMSEDALHFLPEYDYVVVGSGTAGSVVASRLAQDPSVSVLLLEAGGDPSFFYNVPMMSPLLQLSACDWQYETVAQDSACLGLHQKVSHWPMGKIVGGSSRLNYLMYVRGHHRDFDSWGKNGNIGWFFDDVLPYFKKFEGQEDHYKSLNIHHSRYGPLHVTELPFSTPFARAFVESGKELGYREVNLNLADDTGFMMTQVTMRRGSRHTADQAFLSEDRGNLKLLRHTLVTKVLFRDNYEAHRVKFLSFGDLKEVTARRAVILTAGTIGSAKLLLLSGIGPKDQLSQIGVPVIQNLPVGQNLQDHVTTGLDLVTLNVSLPVNFFDIVSPNAIWQYLVHGTGPWTLPGCEALAVVHSELSNSDVDAPDLQFMAMPMGLTTDRGAHMKRVMGISDQVWKDYFEPLKTENVASIMPVLLHPQSRGVVSLRSANPLEPPDINPRYLSNTYDVKVLYEGIKLVKKLVASAPMQSLGAQLNTRPFPGCEHLHFDTPTYWYCYVRHLTITSYHPIGTCQMGPSSNPSAVVDPRLRVLGTNHLFVLDASVMPSLPSGNINAAVMMIAEKGADMVKEEWYLQTEKSCIMEVFISATQCNSLYKFRIH